MVTMRPLSSTGSGAEQAGIPQVVENVVAFFSDPVQLPGPVDGPIREVEPDLRSRACQTIL